MAYQYHHWEWLRRYVKNLRKLETSINTFDMDSIRIELQFNIDQLCKVVDSAEQILRSIYDSLGSKEKIVIDQWMCCKHECFNIMRAPPRCDHNENSALEPIDEESENEERDSEEDAPFQDSYGSHTRRSNSSHSGEETAMEEYPGLSGEEEECDVPNAMWDNYTNAHMLEFRVGCEAALTAWYEELSDAPQHFSRLNNEPALIMTNFLQNEIGILRRIRDRLFSAREQMNKMKMDKDRMRKNHSEVTCDFDECASKLVKFEIAFEVIDMAIEMKNLLLMGHTIDDLLVVNDEADEAMEKIMQRLSSEELKHILIRFLQQSANIRECGLKHDSEILKCDNRMFNQLVIIKRLTVEMMNSGHLEALKKILGTKFTAVLSSILQLSGQYLTRQQQQQQQPQQHQQRKSAGANDSSDSSQSDSENSFQNAPAVSGDDRKIVSFHENAAAVSTVDEKLKKFIKKARNDKSSSYSVDDKEKSHIQATGSSGSRKGKNSEHGSKNVKVTLRRNKLIIRQCPKSEK